MSPAPAQQTVLGRKNRACVITQAVRASAVVWMYTTQMKGSGVSTCAPRKEKRLLFRFFLF